MLASGFVALVSRFHTVCIHAWTSSSAAHARVTCPRLPLSISTFTLLIIRYATPGCRLFPEAVAFLADVLSVLTGQGSCSWVSVAEELTDREFDLKKVLRAKPTALALGWMDAFPHRPITPQWWASIASRCLEILSGFSALYKDVVSHSALFAAATAAAAPLCEGSNTSRVSTLATKFCNDVTSRSTRIMEPLRLQQHRPVPLRALEPDFDDGYRGRKVDPDKDRRETRKLKALHSKEMRGAVRELRRDAKFMARVKLDKVHLKHFCICGICFNSLLFFLPRTVSCIPFLLPWLVLLFLLMPYTDD